MGRKRIDIDIAEVERLAGLGLTNEEIALSLGISPATLYERQKQQVEFLEAIKRGKSKAASEVSNAIYQAAISGNIAAAIWYEKTRRGLVEPKDKPDQTQQEITIRYVNPDDKLSD